MSIISVIETFFIHSEDDEKKTNGEREEEKGSKEIFVSAETCLYDDLGNDKVLCNVNTDTPLDRIAHLMSLTSSDPITSIYLDTQGILLDLNCEHTSVDQSSSGESIFAEYEHEDSYLMVGDSRIHGRALWTLEIDKCMRNITVSFHTYTYSNEVDGMMSSRKETKVPLTIEFQ